jgi:hypothetical protein
MKTLRYLQLLLVAAALIVGAATVNAQATRTWVSGVGDDVNPCSRTAPCKTWAGAISKTAEGGEINALDPGGYGTLTITKALTVDGTTGAGFGHTLNSGGISGFNINITGGIHVNDAVVILRNITINGASQHPTVVGGTNGVNHIKGHRVIVENCVIENQTNTGINQSSLATQGALWVNRTSFTNTNLGIRAATTSGFTSVQVDACNFQGMSDGVNATANAAVTIRNSYFGLLTGGTNGAVRSAAGCAVNVVNCVLASNTIAANAAGGVLRLSNNDLYNNTTAVSGSAESANNNRFRGNTTDGTTTNVIVVK